MYLSSLSKNQELQKKIDNAIINWEKQKSIIESRKEGEFYVVISGQQNSGKSTLGNALLGIFDKEIFVTGDKIVTKENKEYKSNDGITYIDTPGFGTVDKSDELECRKAWGKADLILFLHSALIGGKDQKEEIEMMKALAKHIDSPEKRVILLCTKSARRTKEDLDLVLADMKSIAKDIFGSKCSVMAIDSQDYIDAYKCNEVDKELIQSSMILDVKKWIDKNKNLKSQSEKILEKNKKDLLKLLNKAKENITDNLNKIQNEMDAKEDELLQFWNKEKAILKENWFKCFSTYTPPKKKKKQT